MTAPRTARRAGFTLIELLIVILIVGVLASLLLFGLSAARTSARRAQAVTEIGQISAGITGGFKAKTGATHIPAFRVERIPNGPQTGRLAFMPFRLRARYWDPSDPARPAGEPTTAEFEAAYLRQVFPQINLNNTGVSVTVGTLPAGAVGQDLDPNQMLVTFLTGGLQTNFSGFSTNKAMPFSQPGGNAIGPFLEIKPGKADAAGRYLDPWGVPYAYFAFDPSLTNYPHNNGNTGPSPPATPAQIGVVVTDPSVAPVGIFPDTTITYDGDPVAPNGVQALFTPGGAVTSPAKFENPKGFQIISAGADRLFGRGGAWTAGQGDYVSNGIGGDDLSNFNQGPLNQRTQ